MDSHITPEPRRILALAGSLRRGSFNRHLLDAAAARAPAALQIEVYDGLGDLPMFDEDLEADAAGLPAPVRRLRAALDRADGLLLATPEYNHSFPAVLKNAIDWLSRPAPGVPLAHKPVALVGATRGRWGTRLAQAALRQVLFATESLVLPQPALYLASAERAFDAQGVLADAALGADLDALLQAFDAWIRRVGSERTHVSPV